MSSMRAGSAIPSFVPKVRRGAFKKREGCLEISTMSACRVMAQNGAFMRASTR